jgi:hypothetical protein
MTNIRNSLVNMIYLQSLRKVIDMRVEPMWITFGNNVMLGSKHLSYDASSEDIGKLCEKYGCIKGSIVSALDPLEVAIHCDKTARMGLSQTWINNKFI